MKIIILNGSPKGKKSVTMQYFRYLEKRFPGHEFSYINAAQKARLYEKDEKKFDEKIEEIKSADILFWGTPLYFLLVPSRFKQFIEMVFQRGKTGAFRGKYTGVLTTSIHFADHTAQNYLKSVSEDLGMNHVDFFPAAMNDLKKPAAQRSLDAFFLRVLSHAEKGIPVQRTSATMEFRDFSYSPGEKPDVIPTGKRVTIVADIEEEDSNIARMVERFRSNFTSTEIISLRQIKMNSCTGCINCGYENRCLYEETDDEYLPLYREKVLTSDILVFAGEIRDRYLSSYWQRYLERSFVRNHQPLLENRQVIFLISGPLSRDRNIGEILQMYTETMKGNIVSMISDEYGDSANIDRIIDSTARDAVEFSENRIARPLTFLGTGGMKIFRDDIFGGLRFVFRADHRYYKKLGLYDFPHKKRLQNMLLSIIVLITGIPPIRKKVWKQLTSAMLTPFRPVIEKTVPSGNDPFSENAKETGGMVRKVS